MRATGRLFAIIGVFFLVVGLVYGYLSHEPAGTAALIFTAGLGAMIAVYFLFTARRLPLLPEDDDHANIEDDAGEYGFFSPHSWWPLPIGAGAGITALGLVFLSWWLILFGVVVIMTGVTGLLFEYYRGEFVRH